MRTVIRLWWSAFKIHPTLLKLARTLMWRPTKIDFVKMLKKVDEYKDYMCEVISHEFAHIWILGTGQITSMQSLQMGFISVIVVQRRHKQYTTEESTVEQHFPIYSTLSYHDPSWEKTTNRSIARWTSIIVTNLRLAAWLQVHQESKETRKKLI